MNIATLILSFGAALILVVIALRKVVETLRVYRITKSHFEKIISIQTNNRQKIMQEVGEIAKYYSDWAILSLAHKKHFSGLVISCLPRIYFVNTASKCNAYLWKEVVNIIPENCIFEVEEKICSGEILKISFSEEAYNIINKLALLVEDARLNNPYPSYSSLLGVINQHLNELELVAKNRNNESLAFSLQTERKELLSQDLRLSIS